MALTITGHHMASTDTNLTAWQTDPTADRWAASWLPELVDLTRSQAVTALVLAETVARTPDLHPGHRAWPLVQVWAEELVTQLAPYLRRDGLAVTVNHHHVYLPPARRHG